MIPDATPIKNLPIITQYILEIIERIAAGMINKSAIFMLVILLEWEYFTHRRAPTELPNGITDVIIPYSKET